MVTPAEVAQVHARVHTHHGFNGRIRTSRLTLFMLLPVFQPAQVQFMGQAMSVNRPSGYVDPQKAAVAAAAASQALTAFQRGDVAALQVRGEAKWQGQGEGAGHGQEHGKWVAAGRVGAEERDSAYAGLCKVRVWGPGRQRH